MQPPTTITLRQPSAGEAELVIGHGDHTCTVYQLSFAEVRKINRQTAEIVEGWPVHEVPAM